MRFCGLPVAKGLRGLAWVVGLGHLTQPPARLDGRAGHVGQRLVECGVGPHGLGSAGSEDIVLVGRGQRGPELGGVGGQGNGRHAPQAQVGHRGQRRQPALASLPITSMS